MKIAGDQFGLFTLAQAQAFGVRRHEIDYRIKAGHLDRVLPGVLSVQGTPESWRRNVMAATCWAGDASCASFASAARLWGLDGYGHAGVEISTLRTTLKSNRVLPDESRITVHRVDERLTPEIAYVDAIPVSSVRRTLIDLAGRRDWRVERALDRAIGKNLTSIPNMWLLLEREWMRGRRGVRVMRDLLALRTPQGAPTDSELEVRMLRILRRCGFPAPQQQYPIQLGDQLVHADFAFPEIRLAIETDGYAFHMDGRSFELDRRRDNDLRSTGWDVRRFTWAMLRYDIPYVERVLEPFRARLSQIRQ